MHKSRTQKKIGNGIKAALILYRTLMSDQAIIPGRTDLLDKGINKRLNASD